MTAEQLSGAQVLVSGATGFIGKHLVTELLQRGCQVHCLVRSTNPDKQVKHDSIKYLSADLRNPGNLKQNLAGHCYDYVYHLAGALSGATRREFFSINEEGTRNLYQTLAGLGRPPKRIIHVSSIAATGPAASADKPRHEDESPQPVSLYGSSKLAGEQVAQGFTHVFPITILRPAVVYGPGDRNLLDFYKMAKAGIVLVPPKQPKLYSMLHVSDLVQSMLHLSQVDCASGQAINIAYPEACSWYDMMTLIGEALNSKAKYLTVGRIPFYLTAAFHTALRLFGKQHLDILTLQKLPELFAQYWFVDTTRLREMAGNVVRINTCNGINETAQWYLSNDWL